MSVLSFVVYLRQYEFSFACLALSAGLCRLYISSTGMSLFSALLSVFSLAQCCPTVWGVFPPVALQGGMTFDWGPCNPSLRRGGILLPFLWICLFFSFYSWRFAGEVFSASAAPSLCWSAYAVLLFICWSFGLTVSVPFGVLLVLAVSVQLQAIGLVLPVPWGFRVGLGLFAVSILPD